MHNHRSTIAGHFARCGCTIIGSVLELSLIGLMVWAAVSLLPILTHSDHANSSTDSQNAGELIFRLSLTDDGKQLAIHRISAEIVALDLASRHVDSICGPTHSPISRSILSHDGSICLQSFEDKRFVISRHDEVMVTEDLTDLTGPIVALSSDGQTAVLVFDGVKIRCWNLARHEPEEWKFTVFEPAQRIAIDTNGSKLAVYSRQDNLHIYDLKTGEMRYAFAAGEPPAGDPMFSDDGLWLASIHHASLDFYNLDTQQIEWTVRISEPDRFRTVAISPDGQKVAACSMIAGIQIIDRVDGELRRRILPDTLRHKVAFSSCSENLYSGRADGLIRVWSVATAQELERIDLAQLTCSMRQ